METDKVLSDVQGEHETDGPVFPARGSFSGVPSLTDRQPCNVGLRPSLPLMEVFESYAAEQRLKPNTVVEWRSMINNLIAFVGHDDAARLTVYDMDRWRDALLIEKTKRGTIRDPIIQCISDSKRIAICRTVQAEFNIGAKRIEKGRQRLRSWYD